jgi:outer membrane receptor protein involved in Fe transport
MLVFKTFREVLMTDRIRLSIQLLSLLFCFACGLTAHAQSTATLQGTVTDPQGAIVPGAKVAVRSQATGIERMTQAGEDGNYQVAALPPGVYRVEAQAQGFQTQVVNDLQVEVARTVTQNFQLTVGSVSQEVTVTSESPVIETATSSVGTVIDQRTVQEIPLNGRHLVDLGLLIPGTVAPNPATGFLTAPIRGQGALAFNTAGNREDTTNFQINGINLNDMVQNQITFQPSISTVQEFKVDNSTFSAEYGRNSGSIVNVATRSGTNDFHGELFEFFRNDALDARNFFDGAKKPPFKRNQYGFSIGGPVILPRFGEGGPATYNLKKQTFFFFSFEGLRQRQGLTANSQVLSNAQRAAVADPASRKLLDLIPVANSADARGNPIFVGAATAPVNLDQWTLDISHNLSQNDRLHGYYAYQKDLRRESLSGTTIPGFGDTRKGRRQLFTLNETHTFGPALVNEVRLGVNRIHITFNPNAALNPSSFGINTGINEDIGLPVISITSIGLTFGGPGAEPQGRGDTTYVLSDTLSYLRGKHAFKFGGEVRRFLNNNFSIDPGTFTFTNVPAFSAGTVTGFSITQGSSTNSITSDALGLFIQDNYKVRQNLTLELGLRYDWNKTPTERFNRFVIFDPATDSLRRVGTDIDKVYHENNKNFQPRFGFAWDPFKNGKTSVRGAYAVLVEQPITSIVSATSSNPPLAIPVALPAGTTTTFASAFTQVRAAGSIAPTSIDPNFDNPYIQSYNLNVQRELRPGLGIMVGYFGSKGTHLQVTRNLNQFIRGTTRRFPTLSPTSPILPNTPLTNITSRESTGNSLYNALWVSANKRLSRGLQFNASYTFSKSIDYNSRTNQGVVVQDNNNLRGDRALSDFDTRHRFVISALYQLPFRGNALVEGWQLSTITQSQSGNPFTIFSGNALLINAGLPAVTSNTLTGNANLRPDLIGPINIRPTGEPTLWFSNLVCDPRAASTCPAGASFAIPISVVNGSSVFHFGNLGRNVITGPRFNNTDFSVVKKTRLSETKTVEFRAEFFDLFNHTNFALPRSVAQFGSTTFGTINRTRFDTGDSGSSRQIQFALKFLF